MKSELQGVIEIIDSEGMILKLFRVAKNTQQVVVAQRMGITPPRLSQIESQRKVSRGVADRFIAAVKESETR
jgi:transcriptional regulator with XRE-family HTH domain